MVIQKDGSEWDERVGGTRALVGKGIKRKRKKGIENKNKKMESWD